MCTRLYENGVDENVDFSSKQHFAFLACVGMTITSFISLHILLFCNKFTFYFPKNHIYVFNPDKYAHA